MEYVVYAMLVIVALIGWQVASIADAVAQAVAELQDIRSQLDTSKYGTIGFEIIKAIHSVEKTMEDIQQRNRIPIDDD